LSPAPHPKLNSGCAMHCLWFSDSVKSQRLVFGCRNSSMQQQQQPVGEDSPLPCFDVGDTVI